MSKVFTIELIFFLLLFISCSKAVPEQSNLYTLQCQLTENDTKYEIPIYRCTNIEVVCYYQLNNSLTCFKK